MSQILDSMSADLGARIANHPMGVAVTMRHGEALSTPLPILLDCTEDPSGVLYGFFSAANPQLAMLRADSRAIITWTAPELSCSRSPGCNPTQSPAPPCTFVEFLVEIEFLDDPSERRGTIQRLLDRFGFEKENRGVDQPGYWNDQLVNGACLFKAWVLRIRTILDPWKSGESEPSNEEDADLRRSGKNELLVPVDLARGNRHESDEADAA